MKERGEGWGRGGGEGGGFGQNKCKRANSLQKQRGGGGGGGGGPLGQTFLRLAVSVHKHTVEFGPPKAANKLTRLQYTDTKPTSHSQLLAFNAQPTCTVISRRQPLLVLTP